MFYVYTYHSPDRLCWYYTDCLEGAVDWGKLNAAREGWYSWWIETGHFNVVYRNEDGKETYTHS
jgi:hypothetical protein